MDARDIKPVIITGGSRGIGLSTANRLREENYTVIIFDIIPPKSNNFDYIKCDVSLESDVKNGFRYVMEKYRRLYGVVNNAGILADKIIWKMTLEDFEKVINVNLKGTWLMCREAAQIMKEQNYGRIVNVSSRAWLGNPGQTNYSASKAGIIGLSRSLALELIKYNVTVNVVAPGLIDTELTRSLPPDVWEKLVNLQPQKKPGKPEDVANAIAFFLDERSEFITGQILYVDGGRSTGL